MKLDKTIFEEALKLEDIAKHEEKILSARKDIQEVRCSVDEVVTKIAIQEEMLKDLRKLLEKRDKAASEFMEHMNIQKFKEAIK